MGTESFTVAYVPGVTVSKWSRIWAERIPDVALQCEGVAEAEQLAVLRENRAQMCFVRLPVDREGVNVIPLYTEAAVVVVPKEHPVALFDQVTVADLADEPRLPVGAITEALVRVAAGLGVVVVPQSIARLHSRRDLVYRPVTDHPPTQIGLAWLVEHTSEHIEQFIGIVRGRTANSSRAAPVAKPAKAAGASPAARQAHRGRARPKRGRNRR